MSLVQIPDELKLSIISWLEFEDICKISLVNKELSSLTKDDTIWKYLTNSKYGDTHIHDNWYNTFKYYYVDDLLQKKYQLVDEIVNTIFFYTNMIYIDIFNQLKKIANISLIYEDEEGYFYIEDMPPNISHDLINKIIDIPLDCSDDKLEAYNGKIKTILVKYNYQK